MASLSLSPRGTPSASPRHLLTFLLVVVLYGAYLRCGSLAHRQLWHDEAWRAQSILHASSYLEIHKPVQFVEYLLGKLGIVVFGPSEIAFRIWSFAAAVSALLCYALVSRHLFSPPVALLCTLFIASSPGLAEHAQEFKSYSLETLIVAAYLLLFIRAERRDTVAAWSCLFGFFFLSMLISSVWAFFCFLPIVVAAKAVAAGARGRQLLLGGSAALVVVVSAALLSRHYTANLLRHGEFSFWERAYLSNGTMLPKLLTGHLYESWSHYVAMPLIVLGLPTAVGWGLLLGSFLVAPILALRNRNILGLFVLFPLALQVLLSLLSLYPFMTRVSTFFFLCALLMLFYLFDLCVRPALELWPRAGRYATGLALLLVFLFMFANPRPKRNESVDVTDFKTVLGTVDLLAKPGDVLLFNIYTSDQVAFYGLNVATVLPVEMSPNEKTGTQEDFDRFLGRLIARHPGKQAWAFGVRRIRSHAMLKHALARYNKHPDIDVSASNFYLMRFTLPPPGPADLAG